ncbi:MAG: histone deacetylase [Acidobacteria bacterium]|nr:histone deacetylase [Acidobacteriota bacterium]
MLLFTDPVCLEHPAPPGYPERPERLAGVLAALRTLAGVEEVETALPDGLEESILALHDEEYVRRFERAVGRGDGLLDSADNPIGRRTHAAAMAAVAAAVAAGDAVGSGRAPRAFVAVRPPGHHAERDRAMGFCFFNQAAIVAERAIARHGASRVAIVDFDVHHGNGTQHLFEERGDVLYASLHQWPFYPGTGAARERGRGEGEGATLNLPLPAGTGDEGYAAAFRDALLPELEAFSPDLLVVSAGFDAWRDDPLGGMRVSEPAFGEWGAWLREAAESSCGGRMVSLLEGGYDLSALPNLVGTYCRNML